MKKNRSITFSVSLPQSMLDKLDEIAESLGVTRSMAIRLIIHDYIGTSIMDDLKTTEETK